MVGTLLGLPGQWAEEELESSDHYTTKIGGVPDWPPIPDDALRPELLNCCSCGSKLSLVAQVYAPISTENSDIQERTLYIFGCLMPKCGTSELSWRAFSIHKSIKEKESSELADLPVVASPQDSATKTHWLDDDDDEEDFDFESLAKAIAEASTTVASNSKKQKSSGTKAKPSPSKPETRVAHQIKLETGPVVPCFYMYTKEEIASKEVDRFSLNYSSLSIKDRENGNNAESESDEAWEDEKYEYDKALNADRTYLKFKKRLDANPEQCFRYSYGGKPILATEDLKSPDKCRNCDSPRHFEMQLMSPLLFFLHEGVVDKVLKQSLDNWDWMTLIVYTCSKSCANAVDGDWVVAEEYIAVQYEKPMNLDHASFFK
ncbi:PREDICTED: probable 20S rRNA accumulation protein 4 [Camelina sativa]|uniref:Probable 20S rRNA accumulation protein 4 n=1 Tax=Camelina sativa TaxID=90675 RepID=A0ABM0VXR2_CAMSA|nr:PREDICTED: probable 20S rRNA accumulation protein 4 [Camelina sativa]